jgi:calpain-7
MLSILDQNAFTECSFIVNLCIWATYERLFDKRLVTSIIYPQKKHGAPIYNKYGVYMVKLWLNGAARRMLVDDRLPVDDKALFPVPVQRHLGMIKIAL